MKQTVVRSTLTSEACPSGFGISSTQRRLRETLGWTYVLRRRRRWFLLASLLGILHHQRPGFLSFPEQPHGSVPTIKRRFHEENIQNSTNIVHSTTASKQRSNEHFGECQSWTNRLNENASRIRASAYASGHSGRHHHEPALHAAARLRPRQSATALVSWRWRLARP